MRTIISEKLPRIIKNKKKLEKILNIKITNRGKEVNIEGSPEDEYIAEKVIDAINFGFPFSYAVSIKKENGELKAGILKFLSPTEIAAIESTLALEDGDMGFIIASDFETTNAALGALRCEIAKRENLIDKEGTITDRGNELASLVLYTQELNNLQAKGLGEKKTKKAFMYGEKENVRPFRKHDRYRDVAIKASIKKALRRVHANLETQDLMTFERDNKGRIFIIYILD